jgi:hypothetical protein
VYQGSLSTVLRELDSVHHLIFVRVELIQANGMDVHSWSVENSVVSR